MLFFHIQKKRRGGGGKRRESFFFLCAYAVRPEVVTCSRYSLLSSGMMLALCNNVHQKESLAQVGEKRHPNVNINTHCPSLRPSCRYPPTPSLYPFIDVKRSGHFLGNVWFNKAIKYSWINTLLLIKKKGFCDGIIRIYMYVCCAYSLFCRLWCPLLFVERNKKATSPPFSRWLTRDEHVYTAPGHATLITARDRESKRATAKHSNVVVYSECNVHIDLVLWLEESNIPRL